MSLEVEVIKMVEATTEVRVSHINTVSNTIIATTNPGANVEFAYLALDDEDALFEQKGWLLLSESALAKGWDNSLDAQYDDL